MKEETTRDVLQTIVDEHPHIIEVAFEQFFDHPGDLDKGKDRMRVWLPARSDKSIVERVCDVFDGLEEGWGISWVGLMKFENETMRYVPQIDFRERVSEAGERKVRKCLTDIIGRNKRALPGWLIGSGQSYHYVGRQLLTKDEWLDFMGLCLLCEDGKDKVYRHSPVDRRWIGHRLRQQNGGLRLFAEANKPYEPKVIGYVES